MGMRLPAITQNLEDLIAGFYVLQDFVATGVPLRAQVTAATHQRWRDGAEWTPRSVEGRQAMWARQARETKATRTANVAEAILDRYARDLARLLRDYLFFAAMGEARHAHANNGIGFAELDSQAGRSSVYRNAVNFDPERCLPILEEFFGSGGWAHGYGGAAWANICKFAQYFYTMPAAVFIDHVVDLSHNGGLCFDKGVLIRCGSTCIYLHILDVKRTARIWDCVYSLQLPRDIYQLVMEAPATYLPTQRPVIKPTERFQYDGIAWGTQVLSEPEQILQVAACGCTASESCEVCDNCGDCCTCWVCESCGNKKSDEDSACPTCRTCEACCECVRCDGCSNMVKRTCDTCEQCEACCDCQYCTSCEQGFLKSDECSGCEACPTCCECLKCPHCDTVVPEDKSHPTMTDFHTACYTPYCEDQGQLTLAA